MRAFLKNKSYFYIMPAIIYLLFFTIYPTIYIWYMSFTEYSINFVKFIGLENYAFLFFRDTIFRICLQNTFYYVLLAVSLEIPLGIGLALLLNREFKGKNIVLCIIMLPMILPPVIVALTFRMLYDPTLGLINYFLSFINIMGLTWLADPKLALPAVVLIDVWQWTPFVILIILSGLQYLPLEILEAATIDGASKLQLFRYVTFPLLKRLIFLTLVFRIVDAFKAFENIFITTRGGPGYATQTLNIYAFLTSFNYFHFGTGAALALIMVFINIILVTILVKIIRGGP
jgi:multiple sugar transport system permease protein